LKKLFLAGLALAISGAAFAQIDPAKTVVTVNGEEIKASEYYHRMEYLPGVGKQVGTSFVQFPPGFLTIEQLITERLLLQLAKQKGVYPSDPEVQAEVTAQTTANPKLMTEWLASGKTKEEYNYQVRLQLAQFKIATAGVTVTDQEIDTYYAKNPDLFTYSKQYKLRIIAVATPEDVKAVDADLAAGKSFSDVAKARSQDLTKSTGGEVGFVSESKLGELKAVVAATKIGKTTEWASAGGAKVKFLVEDIKAPSKQALDATLRRDVRRQLMLRKGQEKNINVANEMLQLRSKATIDIKDKVFADVYKQYVDSFMRKAPTTGGGN
jgi:hypothetical protein